MLLCRRVDPNAMIMTDVMTTKGCASKPVFPGCNKTRDNFVTSRQFKQHELSLTHDFKPTENQRNFTIDEAKPTASPGHHRIMEKLINCSQQRIRPTEAISSLMKAPFFSFEAIISHKP